MFVYINEICTALEGRNATIAFVREDYIGDN